MKRETILPTIIAAMKECETVEDTSVPTQKQIAEALSSNQQAISLAVKGNLEEEIISQLREDRTTLNKTMAQIIRRQQAQRQQAQLIATAAMQESSKVNKQPKPSQEQIAAALSSNQQAISLAVKENLEEKIISQLIEDRTTLKIQEAERKIQEAERKIKEAEEKIQGFIDSQRNLDQIQRLAVQGNIQEMNKKITEVRMSNLCSDQETPKDWSLQADLERIEKLVKIGNIQDIQTVIDSQRNLESIERFTVGIGKQERIKRSNKSLLYNNAAKLREISLLEKKREQIRGLLQNPTEGSFDKALSEYQELDKSYRKLDDEAYQQIQRQVDDLGDEIIGWRIRAGFQEEPDKYYQGKDRYFLGTNAGRLSSTGGLKTDERSKHLSSIYELDDAVLSRNADRDSLLESLYTGAPEGEKLRVIEIATRDFKSRKMTDIISDPSISSYDQLKSTLVGTREDKEALAQSCYAAWIAQKDNVNTKLILFINTIIDQQTEYSPSGQISLMITDEDIEDMVNSMTEMLKKPGDKYKKDAKAMMEKIAKREEKKNALGIEGPNFSKNMNLKLEFIIAQLYPTTNQAARIRKKINRNQQTANRSTHGNQGATNNTTHLQQARKSPKVTPENIKQMEGELKKTIRALFKQNSEKKGSRFSFKRSASIEAVTKSVIATATPDQESPHNLTGIMANLKEKIEALKELKEAKETDPMGKQSKKDLAYSIRMAKPTSRGPS